MTAKHLTDLNDLLASRGVTGSWLARELPSSEATVSNWRRGLPISPPKRERIIEILDVTEEEIAELGWGKETAGV